MKRRICTIAINKHWNTHIVHIFREEPYVKLNFYGHILSRLTKPVDLSHERVLTYFKYQEPAFYGKIFDDSKEVPFKVPTGRTNFSVMRKPVLGSPRL